MPSISFLEQPLVEEHTQVLALLQEEEHTWVLELQRVGVHTLVLVRQVEAHKQVSALRLVEERIQVLTPQQGGRLVLAALGCLIQFRVELPPWQTRQYR